MRKHELTITTSNVVNCIKCSYKWLPRGINPKHCPQCRTINWNKTKDKDYVLSKKLSLRIIKIIENANMNQCFDKILALASSNFSNKSTQAKDNEVIPCIIDNKINNSVVINTKTNKDKHAYTKDLINKECDKSINNVGKAGYSTNTDKKLSDSEALTAEQIFDDEIFRIIGLDCSDAEKHELKLQAKKKLDEVIFDAAKK